MADLKTSFMGLELKNPVIAGASRLTANLETLKGLEASGVAAVVIASLFEEQIRLGHDRLEDLLMGFDSREQSEISIFPGMAYAGPEEHLEWVSKAKRNLSIPVIASLNAVAAETWTEWARKLAATGVDALELNFYTTPVDPDKRGSDIEDEQVDAVARVCRAVSLPVSVKLSPFYANPLQVMKRMAEAGAGGFVLFNRFFQPDIDAETEKPRFVFDLSEREENRLPLRFTALANGRVKGDLVASTAVLTAADMAKMILAGAGAVQMVTAFYRHGLDYAGTVLSDFSSWMDRHGYGTIGDFRGRLDKRHADDPHAWERAQYVRILMRSDASVGRYPLL
jgi:dihydroorotate dehydrogenase (fumarate)